MLRLTKSRCQKLLERNEGFISFSNFTSNNEKEERIYKIFAGQLHVFADGKDLKTREPYVKAWIASDDEVWWFLMVNRHDLNTIGIE